MPEKRGHEGGKIEEKVEVCHCLKASRKTHGTKGLIFKNIVAEDSWRYRNEQICSAIKVVLLIFEFNFFHSP